MVLLINIEYGGCGWQLINEMLIKKYILHRQIFIQEWKILIILAILINYKFKKSKCDSYNFMLTNL